MRQFITIATNAFMELVRQPVFLLLMTCSAVFEIFLATPYYFAFGDEPKLVKNSTLAAMLLTGLLRWRARFAPGPPLQCFQSRSAARNSCSQNTPD